VQNQGTKNKPSLSVRSLFSKIVFYSTYIAQGWNNFGNHNKQNVA